MKSLIRILITVFAVIFIYSCGNDTIVNNPPPPSGLFTLNGTIENWTLGGNIQLRAFLSDTNFWGNSIVISTDTISTGRCIFSGI